MKTMARRSASVSPPRPEARRESATVFVVDDDPAMRDSLRWLLASAGFAVETFESAEQFLRTCEGPRGGCIVADVRLPGMDGFCLQRELQARAVELPLILISAFREPLMVERAASAGAVDFLRKPFDDQMLLDAVSRAMGHDRLGSSD
jgi:FixJ family two-component response regulator